jgi:Family of unknown function (DUF6455)
MWTALFAIVVAAAAGCVLAAVWLTPRCGSVSRHRKDHRSPMVAFVAGCRDLSRTACAAFAPKQGGADGPGTGEPDIADIRMPDLATRRLRDTALLSRGMKFLHIDPDRLARSEPLLFRQLAIRCGQCERTEQCARDLDRAATDPTGEDWKDYCLNASLLGMLSAIAAYASAAQNTSPISRFGEGSARRQ